MKKFLARFAVLGVFAGLLATSYALPASAATTDTYTAVAPDAEDIIIIIIGDDYVVVYLRTFDEANAVSPGQLATAVTDQMFDQ